MYIDIIASFVDKREQNISSRRLFTVGRIAFEYLTKCRVRYVRWAEEEEDFFFRQTRIHSIGATFDDD